MASRNPRIAFITWRDGRSRKSNAHYYLANAIREHLGPLDVLCPQTLPGLRVAENRAVRHARRLLRLQSGPELTLELFIGAVNKVLCEERHDLIVSPMGSSYLPWLETKKPIVYLSDATQRLLFDYYDTHTGLAPEQQRSADENERASIARAAHISYPSSWARDSAIEHYGGLAEKISVIPWGANLDLEPAREEVLRPRTSEHCDLLFLGTQWERKGGPFAVRVLLELRRRGTPARLLVCGVRPQGLDRVEGIKILGRLNKDIPKERKLLEGLLLNSHFLLFPTLADCWGHVLCEAGAFGLPVIARATGGVPEVVTPGINGILMDASATAEEYADRIQELWDQSRSGNRLATRCRDNYEERLSWKAWGREFAKVTGHLVHG